MNNKFKFYIFLIRWYMPIMIAAAVGLFAVAFFPFQGTAFYKSYPYVPLLGGGVVLVLFYLTLKQLIKHGYAKINSTLNERCDPEAFVSICSYMLDKIPAGSPTLPVQRLNIATGLIAAGRYGEALSALSQVGSMSLLYIYNMCLALTGNGELERAEEYLQKYRDVITGLHYKNDDQKKAGRERADFLKYVLRTAKGNYKGADEAFEHSFALAQNEYSRVNAKYHLGEAYLNKGEKEKAREAFEYAAQHGNKLYVAQLAREKLRETGAFQGLHPDS